MRCLVPFILLAACDGGSTVLAPGEKVDEPVPISRSCTGLPTDNFQLGTAMTIEPDRILRVPVTYYGGCETHTFAACWDGSISKTNPSTLSIELFHDAHHDACDGSVARDLFIDLAEMPTNFVQPERSGDTSIRLTQLF